RVWAVLASVALVCLAGCGGSQETTTFTFQMTGLQTPRQGGATVDVIVAMRYADGTPSNQIPDYRPIAELVAEDLLPSDALPAQMSWEALGRAMAPEVMEAGPMSGVSIALRIHPKCDGKSTTDLVRMAVVTEGNIDPVPYAESADVACQRVQGASMAP
ncbi:MAG: hypothetical protein ACKOFX_01290, partial [Solirubrobacterales bacterium]